VRFADDLVILIDVHPRHDWVLKAAEKRLREELANLQVEINEEKSRIVDLGRGESFGFLGFDFRVQNSRTPRRCLTPGVLSYGQRLAGGIGGMGIR
jgi:hypothetical protein